MSKLKWISAIIAIISLPSHAQTDLRQSDTVPSSILEANFGIVNSETPNMVQAVVQLAAAKVRRGVEENIPLTQSNDDVVTISAGSTSIVYDPTNTSPTGNLLPLVPTGTYEITFKRFNGQTFHSAITLPAAIVITQPTPNTVFKKGTRVDITWQALQADEYEAITEWTGNCNVGNEGFTATGFYLDANFASECTGPLPVTITLAAINEGKGYGLSSGLTVGSVPFSYEDASGIRHDLSNREKALRIMTSHLGHHAIITIQH